MAGAQVTVVFGPYIAAEVFRDVAPLENPCPAEGGQPLFDVTAECRVAPRSACVVNPHGLVYFDGAIERLGRCKLDLAHGHAEAGVNFSFDVYAAGIWQRLAAVGFDGALRCDHFGVLSLYFRIKATPANMEQRPNRSRFGPET